MNNPVAEPDRQTATVADQLAHEIKRLRLDAGLSQRALATKIGYSRQYVSMTEWEDTNLPSQELIAAIDAALDANGTLNALRTEAKIDHQLQVPLDPRVVDVTKTDPAGHPHDLTAVSALYPCQADAADDVRTLAKEAGSVDVMAVRGLGILGLNDSLLRKTIPAATQLRVLLLNPDSAAVARRADEIGESTESFAAGIRLAIARVKELAAAGSPVEVYIYDQIPVWRIIRIDDVLFVSAFTIQHEGHASPIHRIEPSVRGVLHHAFVRTLEQTFSHADRVV
ncbi:helix-turn-helix domain-containing protein [Nocardia vinacea]|uniref:helix-turn-helix transcriptional regulator n=1 Tax=Nocardia vinacea TaxID=96468 RepID=UPI002E0E389F|nr:helix-turn-helix domain-containing protein [Nocardia vinacea]